METRVHAVIATDFKILVSGLVAFVLLIGLTAASSAHATFGELGQVGSFGPGAEQFEWPQDLAVDSSDNDVFVLDEPGAARNGIGPTSFRLQKFGSNLGAALANVSVPTPLIEGRPQNIEGMAVDPVAHRLYILKGAENESEEYFATEIEAYSTETLTTEGVYYAFPHEASGALHELKAPHGLAVDPNGDLIVLGVETRDTVLQRIHAKAWSATFIDNTEPKVIARKRTWANGVAVGQDGSIYLVVGALPTEAGTFRGIVKLSPDFQTATVVREEGPSLTEPSLTGGAGTGGPTDYGPQVAAAPEADLVYAVAVDREPEGGTTPGSYEVRGMSTEEGVTLGSQEVVFGGGSGGRCEITSSENAVAAGSGGVVYALDEGALGLEEKPTPYGFHLVKFGPGAPKGNGCPIPTASFTINGISNSQKSTITKGEKAQFEASAAGLNGETPSTFEWALEGNGKYMVVPGSNPKASMWYSKSGKYDIGLKILLEHGGSFGEPEPAAGEIEVISPSPTASFESSTTSAKPGEMVTFDGSGSLDPTGLCVPAEEVCKPTHELEHYVWTFGDGGSETTTTGTYSRVFANPSSEARTESVTLTVTNKEGIESSPTTQMITILGTPSAGGGGGGGGAVGTSGIQPPAPGPAITGVVTTPKPLTKSQKLAKALTACKKIKAKHRRKSCEKQAKRRYAPVHRSHKRHGKK